MIDHPDRSDEAGLEGRQVRITVSLDKNLGDQVLAEAETRRVSVSQLMRHAVRTLLSPGTALPRSSLRPTRVPPSIGATSRGQQESARPQEGEPGRDEKGVLRLPFGSEFTPRTIGSLREALEFVHDHSCTLDELQESLRSQYFSNHSISNQRTLAYNCALSMRNYGLVDTDGRLTPLGERLYEVREQPDRLHRDFARHIVLNLGGLQLLEAIRDETKAGRKPTLETIRPALENRGATMPRGSKHVSTMRSWLQEARILDAGWNVAESRVTEILGLSLDDVDTLASLSQHQRHFLRALALKATEPPPYFSNEIIASAERLSQQKFPEKSAQAKIIEPLERAGLITMSRTTGGRGARAFEVTPTDKFRTDILEPILSQLERGASAELIRFLRMPLRSVLEALDAPSNHERGLALEALTIKLLHSFGCEYIGTRVRSTSTGGAEVDALFESRAVGFIRWQVQCKNKERVTTDDIAKEIGVAQMLGAQAVVMITTGSIIDTARQFAQQVMQSTSTSVYLLDGVDIELIAENRVSIFDVFARETAAIAALKRLSV
ncbi:MAG TPA: restriction endonuclease [Gemmatimonadaceae bacterium]|nr:restriction endonuclease [Gemmatimonadaceae bacterium]